MPLATFKSRVDQLMREVRDTRPLPGGHPAHAPGERAEQRRARDLAVRHRASQGGPDQGVREIVHAVVKGSIGTALAAVS